MRPSDDVDDGLGISTSVPGHIAAVWSISRAQAIPQACASNRTVSCPIKRVGADTIILRPKEPGRRTLPVILPIRPIQLCGIFFILLGG